MSEIQRDEFTAWMQVLQRDIQGVKASLDLQSVRLRDTEEDVARHDERLKTVETAKTKDPTARWTGVMAIAGGVLFELFKKLTGSPQ